MFATILLVLNIFNFRTIAIKSINQLLSNTYVEATLSERTCRGWLQRFKNGDFHVEDRHSGGAEKVLEEVELEAHATTIIWRLGKKVFSRTFITVYNWLVNNNCNSNSDNLRWRLPLSGNQIRISIFSEPGNLQIGISMSVAVSRMQYGYCWFWKNRENLACILMDDGEFQFLKFPTNESIFRTWVAISVYSRTSTSRCQRDDRLLEILTHRTYLWILTI